MASVIWPAGLPQAPQVARYSQVDQDRTVRTAMDVGPAKVRRRATAAIETCDIELSLTRTQVATLKTFFRDSVQAGAIPFEWKHHETGNQTDYRFLDQPTFTPRAPRQAGTEIWSATFRLEAMPGAVVTPPPPPPPPPPGEPVMAFNDPPHLGPNALLELELQSVVASYFDAPDVIVPQPDVSAFVFISEVTSDDALMAAIIGSDAGGVVSGGGSTAAGPGVNLPSPPTES